MNTNRKIRILIADDHAVVRMGLAALFETESDFSVVAEAKDGEEAVAKAAETDPDVVIMDLVMPKMDGVQATVALKKILPRAKSLILTSFATSDGIAKAIRNGAAGAVLKNAENSDLIAAIRTVAAGGEVIPDDVRTILTSKPSAPSLSPRQRQILASITRGLTNTDIARELNLSRPSVKTHIAALFSKIGAANRTEAAALALKNNLLQ